MKRFKPFGLIMLIIFCVLLVLIFTTLVINKPTESPSKAEIPSTPLAFSTVAQGLSATTEQEPDYLVITSDSEWNQLNSSRGIVEAQQVDFSKDVVIAVFRGTQPSGGYSTEITEIKESGSIMVHVLEKSPGLGCNTTSALTSPYHIISITKSDKKIEFQVQQKVIECLS